jgi:hypothetical protein
MLGIEIVKNQPHFHLKEKGNLTMARAKGEFIEPKNPAPYNEKRDFYFL